MTALEGTWKYQSFLIRPTPSEEAAPPGAAVTAHKWGMGTLILRPGASPEVSGDLQFGPGVTLTVKGHVLPASDSSSAILVATGEGTGGLLKGMINWITGVIMEADGQQSIYGSVLGVRGPDTKPDDVGRGQPVNTVGAFTLSPIADK